MSRSLVVVGLLLLAAVPARAGDTQAREVLRHTATQAQALCAEATSSGEDIAQRGCCSWHGGVCGCSGSRVVCCDGRLSPSCRCHRESPPDVGPVARNAD
jgi:hypothetical protein